MSGEGVRCEGVQGEGVRSESVSVHVGVCEV